MRTDFLLFQVQVDNAHTAHMAHMADWVARFNVLCDAQPMALSVYRVAQTEQGVVYAYARLAHPQALEAQLLTALNASFQLTCGQGGRISRLQLALQPEARSKNDKPQFHYVVETDTDEGWFDKITDWYDQEHMPGLAAVPGTVSAMRLINLDAKNVTNDNRPRSFACYDLTSPDVLTTSEWLAVRHTAWSDIARPHFKNTLRTMFKVIPT